jgi:hypothetical protein
MNRYACTNPSCPRRDPVNAAEPPTCYTCERPMAEVAPEPVVMMEPYIYEDSEYFDRKPSYDPINAQFDLGYTEYPRVPVPHPAPDVAEALRRHGVAPASSQAAIVNAFTGPALYISLHDQVPGERDVRPGPELSYPGYRRMRVDRGRDGQWPERVTVAFPSGTTPCVACFFGISHSETGLVLWLSEIHPHIHIDRSVVPQLILNQLGKISIS